MVILHMEKAFSSMFKWAMAQLTYTLCRVWSRLVVYKCVFCQ